MTTRTKVKQAPPPRPTVRKADNGDGWIVTFADGTTEWAGSAMDVRFLVERGRRRGV